MIELNELQNININIMEAGQKVIYQNEVRTIYAVYDDENVSLCLQDDEGEEYDDVEEDYTIPIKDIKASKL